ncbi:hypothetical protein [Morganella morganii]|uniref:hypothetical protein n=1 Tax=Morganella morganii TaxID=582 RepID=UPI0034E46983
MDSVLARRLFRCAAPALWLVLLCRVAFFLLFCDQFFKLPQILLNADTIMQFKGA